MLLYDQRPRLRKVKVSVETRTSPKRSHLFLYPTSVFPENVTTTDLEFWAIFANKPDKRTLLTHKLLPLKAVTEAKISRWTAPLRPVRPETPRMVVGLLTGTMWQEAQAKKTRMTFKINTFLIAEIKKNNNFRTFQDCFQRDRSRTLNWRRRPSRRTFASWICPKG